MAVYQVKQKDLKNIESIIQNAIPNTFAAMDIPSDLIEDYMKQAGEIHFTKNSDRKATSWVVRAGEDTVAHVVYHYNGIDKMMDDTIETFASNSPVNVIRGAGNAFYPNQKCCNLSGLKN